MGKRVRMEARCRSLSIRLPERPCWGGSTQLMKSQMCVSGRYKGLIVLSEKLKQTKLRGCKRTNSIAIISHKMPGVQLTCSFLLGKDISP